MAEVFVGLGSNVDARYHLRIGLKLLAETFGELSLSPVFESEAVGFEGDNFLNLVACFRTSLRIREVQMVFQRIEQLHGRNPSEPRFAPRTLDLDMLTYDDCVGEFGGVVLPREEILYNAFVLWPLAELAGDRCHPLTGKRYAQHWAEYDKSRQRLWRLDSL